MLLETQRYRTALFLNKLGVDLASLKCFREAVDVLDTAILLLKLSNLRYEMREPTPKQPFSLININSQPGIDIRPSKKIVSLIESENETNFISQTIHEASIKISVAKKQKYKKEDEFEQTVVTHNNVMNKAILDIAMSCPSSRNVCFMKIDDWEGQRDIEDCEFDSELSLLLHNLATVLFMYGVSLRKKGKKSQAEKSLSKSQKLYKLALYFLSINQSSSQSIDEHQLWPLVASSIILQGLLNLSIELGLIKLGRFYYCALGDRRSMISNTEEYEEITNLSESQSEPMLASAA